ncbi:hypothetical protein PXK01_04575 [Phaeobacter sp. PT47_59]|uniref:hypothetical protein n=1 Tax=Phaeobacter sp. PT47_59 TaxID=3029979 RepID=UPI0023801FC4|nr:hypothetical protein [Phaeobacter sp. PT47_59]MDE4173418.1 hypothetical protein [Phaeobacter sp. PT47_59]
MKHVFASVCCVMALHLGSAAQAFTTSDGVRVNPVSPGVFEVIPQNSGSPRDFWCGASEYARRVLGAGWQDKVYVLRGRGVSVTTGKRSAVQFTLSAERIDVPSVGRRSWLRIGLRVGDALSVQQAGLYCHDRSIDP